MTSRCQTGAGSSDLPSRWQAPSGSSDLPSTPRPASRGLPTMRRGRGSMDGERKSQGQPPRPIFRAGRDWVITPRFFLTPVTNFGYMQHPRHG